jgi:hypothetical protein
VIFQCIGKFLLFNRKEYDDSGDTEDWKEIVEEKGEINATRRTEVRYFRTLGSYRDMAKKTKVLRPSWAENRTKLQTFASQLVSLAYLEDFTH